MISSLFPSRKGVSFGQWLQVQDGLTVKDPRTSIDERGLCSASGTTPGRLLCPKTRTGALGTNSSAVI